MLHLGESTVELPFSPAEARNLGRSFNGLLQTFKDKQEAAEPRKWEMMSYTYDAQETEGVTFLQVMCNPNAFPSAFDAKLMVTIQSESGMKITGEAHLSQTKSDLQTFISQHVPRKQ